MLDLLKNPFVCATLAALITYGLMYLDCKISNERKNTMTYCKNVSLVSSLVGGAVFLSTGGLDKLSKPEIDVGEPGF